MFKVGDKVIHSSYGLCEIAAIDNANTYYANRIVTLSICKKQK